MKSTALGREFANAFFVGFDEVGLEVDECPFGLFFFTPTFGSGDEDALKDLDGGVLDGGVGRPV
jgi:hypothetical protein